MHRSPHAFTGTLADLYRQVVAPILPDPEAVARYHALLRDYCAAADPLFLVRAVSTTKRGEIIRSNDGSRFRPTDNSPAWWMHYHLLHTPPPNPATFVSP